MKPRERLHSPPFREKLLYLANGRDCRGPQTRLDELLNNVISVVKLVG